MTQSHNNSNLDDELLSAYLDGELTDAERAAVVARLETDPAARELVAEMRSLSGTLKSLPREKLADDLRGAVLNQIGTSPVALPPAKLSVAHRLIWPAIAIAAALMLMFVQGNEKSEVDRVASADGRAAERRERTLAGEDHAAFEASEEEAPKEEVATLEAAAAPGEPPISERAAAGGELATVAEPASPRADSTVPRPLPGEAVDESAVVARRMTAAMADSDAELEGVVHLTLTDFRSGAERFNRLLVSNGVQFVDAQPAPPASVATPATGAPAVESYGASENVATMATRSGAPAGGGFGGAISDAATEGTSLASERESQPEEPEMVLVEAPPEQIEQILFGCAQDTEAIEDVAVDPTASGMNSVPAQQRMSDFQQYSRSSGKLALGGEYKITPEQQGVIAVLNSLPKQMSQSKQMALSKQIESAEPTPEAGQSTESGQQSGWAARFYANEQPFQADKLNSQYNQYRDHYFSNQVHQQEAVAKDESAARGQKLAKGKVIAEEPLRVLFLLHPSADAAKK